MFRRIYRSAWPNLPAAVQRKFPKPETGIEGLSRIAHVDAEIGPAAIPALTRQFHDPDGGVRVNALNALNWMNGDKSSAVPAVIEALTNSEAGLKTRIPTHLPMVKRAAMTVLGQIGPQARSALPELTKLLAYTNAYVRVQATVALWRITRDDHYANLLITDFKKTDDAEIVGRLLEAFGEIGAIVALPAIREKFRGKALTSAALDAIGKIDPDALYRFNSPSPAKF